MKLDNTITVGTSENSDVDFSVYTLKIKTELFKQFKIKSLTDNNATYRETLTKLIEDYVNR